MGPQEDGPWETDSSVPSRLAGIGLGVLCVRAACIPFVAKWWADVDHFCTVCNEKVAHVPYHGVAQPIRPRVGETGPRVTGTAVV